MMIYTQVYLIMKLIMTQIMNLTTILIVNEFANEFVELNLNSNNDKILIGYFHNVLLDFYFCESYF